MRLVVLFDHRYYRDDSGTPRSKTHYAADLFQRRYQGVFDEVDVLARLEGGESGTYRLGEGVNLVSIGDWNSLRGLIVQRSNIVRVVRQHLQGNCALLMISPSTVGNLLIKEFIHEHRPYGVEVVGNPSEAMAAGAVKHPLRAFIRWKFCRCLKQICRHATSAVYVTKQSLQSAFPPGIATFARGCSDIELHSEAFATEPRVVSAKQEWRLVHVGTMSQPYKAQDVLIDAVGICRQQGLNLQLTLLGDGALRHSHEAQVARLGLDKAVQFVGHLPPGETVRRQLDQADLFVLPSRTEGLPRATLEAMARGLPCISTNVGGNPELLDDAELVRPNEASELADKIQQLLSNPSRMTQLSRRNLSVAREYQYDLLRQRRAEAYQHLRSATETWLHNRHSDEPCRVASRRKAA